MDDQLPEHRKNFSFFVDGKPYHYDSPSITGAKIKEIAGIAATYQLFLEEEGDNPDLAISDLQGVDLEGKAKHFYAVPPATFGRK